MRRGAWGVVRGARCVVCLVALMLLVAAARGMRCQRQSSGGAVLPAAEPTQLVVASHDSFAVSEEVIQAFEEANNARVQFLTLGDAGAALNKIILSKDSPLADVFFGVDNTFLSRALAADIFEPYASPLLAQIPAALQLDPSHRLLPVDYGFVNLNADQKWFADRGLPLPANARRSGAPCVQGAAGAPEPRHFFAGPGVLAHDHRPFWRGPLSGLLAGSSRPTTC